MLKKTKKEFDNMDRIDVSQLDFIRIEPRGKAVVDKFGVLQNGIMKLVKPSSLNVDQDVMEMLASIILKKIGIDCVEVQLGYDTLAQKNCCLVTSFISKSEAFYDMLECGIVTGPNSLEKSFQQVFEKYSKLYGILDNQLESLKKSYIRILFGKCITENFDSKLENIGLIFDEEKKNIDYHHLMTTDFLSKVIIPA